MAYEVDYYKMFNSLDPVQLQQGGYGAPDKTVGDVTYGLAPNGGESELGFPFLSGKIESDDLTVTFKVFLDQKHGKLIFSDTVDKPLGLVRKIIEAYDD